MYNDTIYDLYSYLCWVVKGEQLQIWQFKLIYDLCTRKCFCSNILFISFNSSKHSMKNNSIILNAQNKQTVLNYLLKK